MTVLDGFAFGAGLAGASFLALALFLWMISFLFSPGFSEWLRGFRRRSRGEDAPARGEGSQSARKGEQEGSPGLSPAGGSGEKAIKDMTDPEIANKIIVATAELGIWARAAQLRKMKVVLEWRPLEHPSYPGGILMVPVVKVTDRLGRESQWPK